MTKKETQVDKIVEAIVTGHYINCNFCDNQLEICAVDEFDAADFFYKKGWRIPRLLTYCPKCAKKYLKQ